MSREALFYVHTFCVQLPKTKGKTMPGDDRLRLVFHNLVSHAADPDLLVWVGADRQTQETGIEGRAVRRCRKVLQDGGLMTDNGTFVGAAKVWKLNIPGYTPTDTGASTPGAKTGAKTGATQGAKTGADTRQTELNGIELQHIKTASEEESLFDKVLEVELQAIPTPVPIEALKKKKAAEYLPVVRDCLEQYPGCSQSRSAAVFILSQIYPLNSNFRCLPATVAQLELQFSKHATPVRTSSDHSFLNIVNAVIQTTEKRNNYDEEPI